MDEILQPLQSTFFFGESAESINIGSTGLFTFFQPNLSITTSSLGIYYDWWSYHGYNLDIKADVYALELDSLPLNTKPIDYKNYFSYLLASNIDIINPNGGLMHGPGQKWVWFPINSTFFRSDKIYVLYFKLTTKPVINGEFDALSSNLTLLYPFAPPYPFPESNQEYADGTIKDYSNPIAIGLRGTIAPPNTPFGKIVEIISPGGLYAGDEMECYADIKNVGAIAGDFYFRMKEKFVESPRIDTGIMKISLVPGQQTRVKLWDYANSKWFIWQGERNFDLSIWHNQEIDDAQLFVIGLKGGSIKLKAPMDKDFPSVAPAGIEFRIIIRTSQNANYPPVMCFTKIIDIDTGELVEYYESELGVNSSKQEIFSEVMPNKDWHLRVQVGLVRDSFVQDSMDITILLGIAEGLGKIKLLSYPEKAPVGQVIISLEWGNFGEITDTIFSKLYLGAELVDETRVEMLTNTGRFKDINVLVEKGIIPFKVEVGHDEQGTDIVDEFREFSIETYIPAILNIDTKPVKGQIFIDGAVIGFAPQKVLLEAGTHIIGFGLVMGYTKPQSQEVTVLEGETKDILGVYKSTGTPNLLILGTVLALGVSVYLMVKK